MLMRLLICSLYIMVLAGCDNQRLASSSANSQTPTPDQEALTCTDAPTAYSPTLSTTNQMTNGDFENATPGTGWTVEGTGGFDDDAGFQYEGENNAWIGMATGFSAIVKQVTVTAEKCFRISAKVRGTSPMGYIGYRFDNDALIAEKNFVTPGSYGEVYYDGYTDRLTEIRFFVGMATADASQYLQIDDVQLVERNCDDKGEYNAALTQPDPVVVSSPEVVAKITGPNSINKTEERYAFKATDLGVMCGEAGTDNIAVLFGDTFGQSWAGWGGFGSASDLRKNVLAYSDRSYLSQGLLFDYVQTDADGSAESLIADFPGLATEISNIPTGCMIINDKLYMYMMAVTAWDPPGDPPGSWIVDRNSLFVSSDYGRNWSNLSGATWDTEANFKQISPLQLGEFVYLLATPEGRHDGGVYLGRVHKDFIPFKTSTAYWDGSAWSYTNSEAATLIAGKVGEPSLQKNECTQSLMMSYLETDSGQILVRQAKQPMGPWSEPTKIGSNTDFEDWIIYGGFMVPDLEGDELHWMMSSWRDYNVYQIKNTIQSY